MSTPFILSPNLPLCPQCTSVYEIVCRNALEHRPVNEWIPLGALVEQCAICQELRGNAIRAAQNSGMDGEHLKIIDTAVVHLRIDPELGVLSLQLGFIDCWNPSIVFGIEPWMRIMKSSGALPFLLHGCKGVYVL